MNDQDKILAIVGAFANKRDEAQRLANGVAIDCVMSTDTEQAKRLKESAQMYLKRVESWNEAIKLVNDVMSGRN